MTTLDEIFALLTVCADDEQPTSVQLQRLPYSEIARDDAFNEAIQIVVDYFVERKCPDWMALLLAREFAESHLNDDLLGMCSKGPQNGETVESFDSGQFSKMVLGALGPFCLELKSRKDRISFLFEYQSQMNRCRFNAFAMKNQRRKMEDRHVCVPCVSLISSKPKACPSSLSLFAVFDGHGGVECAQYSAVHLSAAILNSSAFPTDPSAAFHAAIQDVDKRFCAKARQENFRSGSTAVIALIAADKVSIAWLGDSRIALVERSGTTYSSRFLTVTHDTFNEDECARIEKEGGMVMQIQGQPRVNGMLVVTRSLGDGYMKPPLSSVPETAEITLTGEEECLVLACDGLWDSLDLGQCASLYGEFVQQQNSKDQSDFAKMLGQHAKSNGSSDNITVVVAFLRK